MDTLVPASFLTHTDWAGYLKVREALSDGVHVTYSSGRLELTAPTRRHERRKSVLGSLLEQYLIHKGFAFDAGGSMTMQSEPEGKAMEPDECYWIHSIHSGEDDADFEEVRPHLALEVEVSRLSDGRYEQVEASVLLPDIPLKQLEQHVRLEPLFTAIRSWLAFLNALL